MTARDTVSQPLVSALNKRAYFAEFMYAFFEIPLPYQRAFIEFIKTEVDADYIAADDETEYPELIRSLLFHYSGRGDASQPCKDDLAGLLKDFGSRDVKIELDDDDDFLDDLEDL